ncbi:RecT family recombinase [Pseudomonas lundensis]|uniref:RecT family recombinase n=1 Tax=Serratia proteamaculans TaxID=28151 RepID=UPI002980ACEE|nr:RecT family recombinase [Serratia proteamaculans]MDW5502253.1 RecT family recombinase [Serratia proteamaculans]MDW5507311.1 RecT family recombinase [Pseudomonas lundensis]
MSNELIEVNNQPSTMTASNAVFNPQALGQLTSFANLMADSVVSVPAHFVGKPADCMAVVMQAMQWGMNPYAVAQKTHIVNGTLGYEAQLVNAVVTSSNAVRGRFHYEYTGDWSKCTSSKEVTVKKPAKGGGSYDKVERVRGWSDQDEAGLCIRVGAVLRGEEEITWGEPVYLSSVAIRNSPLWSTNPKQQIAYLAVKYWARLYCPEVILGVYTPDEFDAPQPRVERDVTPPATSAAGLNSLINSKPAEKEIKTVNQDERSPDDLLAAFTEAATKAASVEELDKAYKYGAHVLSSHEEHLQLATDVYKVRRDELNEVPM